MVIAVFFRFDHIDQQAGEVKGVGRRSDLVVDHANGIACLAGVDHGFDEVLPIEAKDPRDADDEIFFQNRADRQFSIQLALAIDVQRRIVFIVRLPGTLAAAVEDVIGRKIEELRAGFLRRLGDVPRAAGVDGEDFFAVVNVDIEEDIDNLSKVFFSFFSVS